MDKLSIIETGVDRLVELVKTNKKISIRDAARLLGVTTCVIQEWAEFLEEEGIINIEYKLTTLYLVDKKLSKGDVETKKKEFNEKKESFIRKVGVMLASLDERGKELKNIKKEFDMLKGQLGLGVDTVKEELGKLEKYEKLKKELELKVEEQKSQLKLSFDSMHGEIEREQKKYQKFISEIRKEESVIETEKKQILSLEDSEVQLLNKLESFKSDICMLENKIKTECDKIELSNKHIDKFKKLSDRIKNDIKNKKQSFEILINKNIDSKNETKKLQEKIIKKLDEEKKEIGHMKQITDRFKTFFSKKIETEELVNKVVREKDDLERELKDLIRKATAFQLITNKENIDEQIRKLEGAFKKVDKKKIIFEKEIGQLVSLL